VSPLTFKIVLVDSVTGVFDMKKEILLHYCLQEVLCRMICGSSQCSTAIAKGFVIFWLDMWNMSKIEAKMSHF